MSNKGIGYVHYLLSDEKVQVNWYDKDQGLLSIKFHQGKTVPRLYKVVTEAEVDFRYGSIEPLPEDEVLHKDVRKESYESLKEKLNKVRKERKVLSKNKRKKSRKKTSPKKMLKNISQEEKERILEILQGDE